MHLFSFLFRIFADNMQILLASAKIMNDRSATKGDACQSKKVNVLPDFTLSTPAFRKEAESFARDMAQYSSETIAEMLGCSHQIAATCSLPSRNYGSPRSSMACFAHWTAFSPIGWRDILSCHAARIKICSDSGRAD